MDLDPANLSPNNLPTPSPTGSSSTLSDDQPLDKNSVNLLGSETDSGVVSLHEARTGDDLKAEFENDTQGDHKVEGQGDSVTSDPLDRDSEDRDTSCNFQNLQGAMFSKRRELPPTLRYNESSKGDSQPDREHLSLPLVSQVETNWPGEEMTTKAVGGVEEGEEEEHLLKVPPQSTDEEEGDVSVEEKDDSPLAVAAAAADKDENDEDLEKSFSPAWQFSSWYFKVEDEDEEDGHRGRILTFVDLL